PTCPALPIGWPGSFNNGMDRFPPVTCRGTAGGPRPGSWPRSSTLFFPELFSDSARSPAHVRSWYRRFLSRQLGRAFMRRQTHRGGRRGTFHPPQASARLAPEGHRFLPEVRRYHGGRLRPHRLLLEALEP